VFSLIARNEAESHPIFLWRLECFCGPFSAWFREERQWRNTGAFDCSADDRPVNAFAKSKPDCWIAADSLYWFWDGIDNGRGAQVFVECDAWRPVPALAKSLFAVEA